MTVLGETVSVSPANFVIALKIPSLQSAQGAVFQP